MDYLGPTTYQGNFSPEFFSHISSVPGRAELAERMKLIQERSAVLGPLLRDHRVHLPMWAVAATRLD